MPIFGISGSTIQAMLAASAATPAIRAMHMRAWTAVEYSAIAVTTLLLRTIFSIMKKQTRNRNPAGCESHLHMWRLSEWWWHWHILMSVWCNFPKAQSEWWWNCTNTLLQNLSKTRQILCTKQQNTRCQLYVDSCWWYSKVLVMQATWLPTCFLEFIPSSEG